MLVTGHDGVGENATLVLDVGLDGSRDCVPRLVACVATATTNDRRNERTVAMILHFAGTLIAIGLLDYNSSPASCGELVRLVNLCNRLESFIFVAKALTLAWRR